MKKIGLLLRSRTFYTILISVLLNTVPQIRDLLPVAYRDLFTVGLGSLAAILHINPSQEYSTRSEINKQVGAKDLGIPPEPPKL
jgi:hypothetical protein